MTDTAVIIIGAGISGVAMGHKLKHELRTDEFEIYEREEQVGGTWYINNYPGCANDIPIQLYSFSFAQRDWGSTLWATQPVIERYIQDVVKEHGLSDHIHLSHSILDANYDVAREIWTVSVKNNGTGEVFKRTCNILITAHGGLDTPRPIDTPGVDTFNGKVLRSQRYDESVDITDKNVVVVGNACTATQIIAEIAPKVKSLTQFARGKQWYIPKPPNLTNYPRIQWMVENIPGIHTFIRNLIFCATEYYFAAMYAEKGKGVRKARMEMSANHMKNLAPAKYHNALIPDFEIGAKRRVFDDEYLKSLNTEKVDLVAERPARITSTGVVKQDGTEVAADVIIFAIGFDTTTNKFTEHFHSNGLSIREYWRRSNVGAYLGTALAPFPNLFLLGTASPNTASGHNSVLFTAECTANYIIRLAGPIIRAKKGSVRVTEGAEREYQQWIREKHQEWVWVVSGVDWYTHTRYRMIWENGGAHSFYQDENSGKNVALYPRSHTHYWWKTLIPNDDHFTFSGVSKPWLMRLTSRQALTAYGAVVAASVATWCII
ncbi:hypothetical protein E3P77_03306 [Wallemia ichthyophaga]|nr:hypothetical protein E3P98_03195 [Wallemia ichthyophaga]TIA89829.1 hypothetical protein E3P97_02820 [Wallemia ichthyophaga]TIA97841.1 hypothetical protein E3P96_03314 [Wallemia ichthyophaga]TIB30956.1 hypothetical protein E3P85_02474 [Wallemia ichthyophaga]TIB45555.1 hypothetical protein E3P82_02749 [Wallemia ichthyophaga]